MQALESPHNKTATPAVIAASDAVDFSTLGPATAIAIRSGGREYRISPNDVMRWIAPGAPMPDAARLLVVSQNVGLNPMLKEIELLDVGGTWQIYVRKQGLIKAAARYPEYDGHETGIVIRKTDDDFAPLIDIPGTIKPRGYILIGGWAKVWRKGWSRPVYKRIALQDYTTGKGLWASGKAVVMCEKTALAHALRESFPLGEVYDEAELPVHAEATVSDDPVYFTPPSQAVATPAPAAIEPEYTPPPAPAPTPAPTPPIVPGFEVVDVEIDDATPDHEKPCTLAQCNELADLFAKLGADDDTRARILEKRGCETVEQLTVWQATDLKIKLIERLDAQTFDFLAAKETAAAAS